MSEMIIEQLKEYAMTVANDMETESGGDFNEELQSAFQRAMEFSELICPACWVRENTSSSLSETDGADSTAKYQCGKCGFNEELEKAG